MISHWERNRRRTKIKDRCLESVKQHELWKTEVCALSVAETEGCRFNHVKRISSKECPDCFNLTGAVLLTLVITKPMSALTGTVHLLSPGDPGKDLSELLRQAWLQNGPWRVTLQHRGEEELVGVHGTWRTTTQRHEIFNRWPGPEIKYFLNSISFFLVFSCSNCQAQEGKTGILICCSNLLFKAIS